MHRAVLQKYIRIRFPVCRRRAVSVCHIRSPGHGRGLFHGRIRIPLHGPGHDSVRRKVCIHRTDFHRNCIRRNFRRRTSTEAVKSRSNCSYFQLLSAIDYAESHLLTNRCITVILQIRNKGVFIR